MGFSSTANSKLRIYSYFCILRYLVTTELEYKTWKCVSCSAFWLQVKSHLHYNSCPISDLTKFQAFGHLIVLSLPTGVILLNYSLYESEIFSRLKACSGKQKWPAFVRCYEVWTCFLSQRKVVNPQHKWKYIIFV